MDKILVLDTNIFVAALLSAEGASREVIRRCLLGEYKPLMGTALYWEYEALLARQEVKSRCPLTSQEQELLLNAFMAVCQWISVHYLWRPNLRDESDNHVLELAIAGNADAVITHNIKDFSRGELVFPHLQLMTPQQLLKKGSK